MIIDCISDLHGYYPELKGGDLLIIAGDLTARESELEYDKFVSWIRLQDYKKKIIVGGNHDNMLQSEQYFLNFNSSNIFYLCDSGTEFEGLKIWGSPWTKNFYGQNPHCKAFGLDIKAQMQEKWDLIPLDMDILITHSPPMHIHDKTIDGYNVGCPYLCCAVRKIRPILHVCGHIHEGYGIDNLHRTLTVNASHVNWQYKPVNPPIRVIINERKEAEVG